MKITFADSISEKSLSSISKITFSGDNIDVGSVYDMNSIQKIEFYADESPINSSNFNLKPNSNIAQASGVSFSIANKQLSLQLQKSTHLAVYIYSLSGRRVAIIYDGISNQGSLNLDFSNIRVANGIYTMIIKADNSVFVHKMAIK
jgi:hypothetical protein